ncbi:MAG: nucleotide sugar dehydrogenase [Cetobacterium sp.]
MLTKDIVFSKKICCVGAGYVGGPTSAVIAYKCPDIQVTVVDVIRQKIIDWNTDDIPIYEPGLLDIVKTTRNKNLFFQHNIQKAIDDADIIMLAVNTPTKQFGIGANYTTDLSYIESTINIVAQYAKTPKIIVEKSTVPCKTSEYIKSLLKSNSDVEFEILSNPEFLSEGTAINDLLNPSRVIIGSENTESGKQAAEILANVYRYWVPDERILTIDIWASELSKLAANAMLAQRISSINSISAICDKVGADIKSISKVIGMDDRIGSKFLNPSIGFGGSCFKKDILSLVYFAKSLYLYEVADYWEGVLKINEYQKNRNMEKLLNRFNSNLSDKTICILGLAYKKDTSDIRESPTLDIVKFLINERSQIQIFDPKASLGVFEFYLQRISNYEQYCTLEKNDTYIDAVKGACAIIIATEWDEFKDYDYQEIYNKMQPPRLIFDGRLIFSKDKVLELKKIGFEYLAI